MSSDGPVIEQEQTHIKTSTGEEIHITCEVHAFPPPLVTWTRYTWEDIKALYQYFVWCFKFPRNGRLMSENSEGVVMSQSDNRYNLILLGSHLSHPAIGKLFLSNIIHLHSELSFVFALHCSVNKKYLSTGNWIFTGSIYHDNDGEIMWVYFSDQWKLLWRVWMSSSQWTGCSQQIIASFRWGNVCFIILYRKRITISWEICKPPGIRAGIISIAQIRIFTSNSSSLE